MPSGRSSLAEGVQRECSLLTPERAQTRSVLSSMLEIAVVRLAHGEGLPLPAFATSGSSGADVCAAVGVPVEIAPMAWVRVPTGLRVAVPEGYELQLRTRSGLAAERGVVVLNSPGTVDSDYRGEVVVLLLNLGSASFAVNRGDRIAQMVLTAVPRASYVESGSLPSSDRGSGGFGHSGGYQ